MRDQQAGWSRATDILKAIAQRAAPSSDAHDVTATASSYSVSPQTPPRVSACRDPRERDYIAAVLECYRTLPGTPTVTSRHDRRCAQEWLCRGVPLQAVKSALVLATARRTLRSGPPLPRVRAVHYFRPVVEEMLELPCEPDYIAYLQRRLQPHIDQKYREISGD